MISALTLPITLAIGLVVFPAVVLAGDKTVPEATAASEADTTVNAEAEPGTDIAQGDIEAGEKLYMKDCRGCHGPTAKGVSSYPKLAGQPHEYLVEQLERYRSGEKIGPNTMLMAPRAKKLSDEDIANVVSFITSIE